jgi:hypothetical protein
MSLVLVRKALEKHLAALLPVISIAYENASFTPVVGTPYQKVDLLPNSPDNRVMGASVYWERGVFQVKLMYPQGSGTAAAGARAELLRNHFRRGTTLAESGVNVQITDTPTIHGALNEGDRYAVPVSIYYQAQINT